MDQSRFICCESIRLLDSATFLAHEPYPWGLINQLLTPTGFQKLYRKIPLIEWFEKHEGLKRHYRQRPDNRYYLAYQQSNYHLNQNHSKGIIENANLHESWQQFIRELLRFR